MARHLVILVACGWGSLCGSACTDASPVATFEGFYRASATRDMGALRQSLCPAERRVLADVDDATLLANVAVVKVLRSVRLESQSEAAAVVVATDAVGAETRIHLRADLHSDTGFCVAGPVAAVAP